jgi:hypothetical protein
MGMRGLKLTKKKLTRLFLTVPAIPAEVGAAIALLGAVLSSLNAFEISNIQKQETE